jgi:hypothetical protein
MKRQIGVAMLVALTALASFASGALAQCTTGMLIKWDENGFAYETLYNPNTFISSATSQLNVVGKVSAFCQMLNGLDALDPTREYTFLFTGRATAAGSSSSTRTCRRTLRIRRRCRRIRRTRACRRRTPTAT